MHSLFRPTILPFFKQGVGGSGKKKKKKKKKQNPSKG